MNPPQFELHTLGWRAFQDLSQVVLRDVLGQQLEVYGDVGIGKLRGIHGAVVAQMKHTTKVGARLALSDFTEELAKVERLINRDLCDSYTLLTNALVSGRVAAGVKQALRERGVDVPVVLGREMAVADYP